MTATTDAPAAPKRRRRRRAAAPPPPTGPTVLGLQLIEPVTRISQLPARYARVREQTAASLAAGHGVWRVRDQQREHLLVTNPGVDVLVDPAASA